MKGSLYYVYWNNISRHFITCYYGPGQVTMYIGEKRGPHPSAINDQWVTYQTILQKQASPRRRQM